MDVHAVEITCQSPGQEIKLTAQIPNFSHQTTCFKNSYISTRVERPASFRPVQAVKPGSGLGMPVRIGWREPGFTLRVLLKGTGKAGRVFFSGRCILQRFIFF